MRSLCVSPVGMNEAEGYESVEVCVRRLGRPVQAGRSSFSI